MIPRILNIQKAFPKPSRLLQKRTLVNPGIKKPTFVKTDLTTSQKPKGNSSASVKNGTSDQKLFTSIPQALNIFKLESSKLFGWFMAFGAIMLFVPAIVKKGSNVVHDVPRETTAAVKLDNFGLMGSKPVVELPNKEVHLTKTPDDDE